MVFPVGVEVIDLHTLHDRIVLALTVWGESRGEPVEGQIAVACVVRNRLRSGELWRDVCLAPEQFSCFNDGDPNAGPIQRAAAMLQTATPTPDLAQALWIADGTMAHAVKDNTFGATHYLTSALLASAPPSWAVGQPVLVVIGHQSFLRVA